jgi:hypothetical protein
MRLLAAALAILVAGAAAAAPLNPVDLSDPSVATDRRRLFTAEFKRDQNVENPGARGHDIFLRDGDRQDPAAGPAFNQSWGASGSVYRWSLAYDGDTATLTFHGVTRTLDVSADGTWTALGFFLNASSDKFSSATLRVALADVNGGPSDDAVTVTGGTRGVTLALGGLSPIRSIAGTLAFDFVRAPGATGSPNGRLGLTVAAIAATPAPVPLPAALPALLAGLGALVLAARRRARRRA